jgi:hypothetical protein
MRGGAGRRAAGQGAGPARPRAARAADRVGELGRGGHGRRDLRSDGAAADRVLRDPALADPRRAVPPVGLHLPSRVGQRAADFAAHRPHRQRVVDRPCAGTERSPRPLRGSALLPARRLRRRPRAGRRRRRRGAAAAGDPPQRRGADRPDQHGARDRRRGDDRPRAPRLRRRHRRRWAGRPLGRRLRRLRGPADAGARRRRHRRPGDVELADPQLPRLPARGQRSPARRERLRAGLGLRRQVRLHARRDRASPRRRPHLHRSLQRGRGQRPRGDPRHRRHLQPPRRRQDRGRWSGPASSTAAPPRRRRPRSTSRSTSSAAPTRPARRLST